MSKQPMSKEAQAAREALRAQTLGAPKIFEPVLVDVFVEQRDPKNPQKFLRDSKGKLLGTKVTYELRPPSIQARGHMLSQAGVRAGGVPEKPAVLQALTIIESSCVPGTDGVRAYEETDFEEIVTWPAGGWPDRLYPEIQKLMARSDIEEAGKNSEEAGASASSSS